MYTLNPVTLKHADDMVHPTLDEFAAQYHAKLPRHLWASVGVEIDLSQQRVPWERDTPEIRAQLREVARRFINGDEGLAIWRLVAGEGGRI